MDARQKALAQLQAWNQYGYQPQQQSGWGAVAAPTYTKKKTTGRGGTLSSLISELGGAGGATGGAVAGAALGSVVPGLGTAIGGIIGAGLGGFLGGTGGRVLENKVRDDRIGLGDALKEGALTGAFGLIPGGVGAKTVASGAKIGTKLGATKAAETGSKNILTKAGGEGVLQKSGSSLRTLQRGIRPGLEIGGKPLSTAEARLQNKAIDKAVGFGGVTKGGQFTKVEKKIADVVESYKRTPEAKAKIGQNQALDMMTELERNIMENASLRGNLTGSSRKVLDNIYQDIADLSGKTNADLAELLKVVNGKAASIVAKGNVGSKEVQVWEEARNALKAYVDKNLSKKSVINQELSPLLGAKRSLSKTITRDVGAGEGQGLTLGRMLSNVAGPAADVAGRGLQRAGGVSASTFGRQARRQSLDNLLLGGTGGQVEDLQAQDMTGQGMGDLGAVAGVQQGFPGQMGGQMGMDQMGGQMGGSQYSMEQAMYDIQRDPKNAAQYMKLYDFVNEASGTTLSAAEKKTAAQQQTALNGLSQLEQLFTSAGGGQNRLPGILGNVQGKLGANSEANAYNQIRDSLTTALARAFGETGVLTDQDREVYKQALPRLEDTPQEAQIKLQYLRDMLSAGQQAQDPYQQANSLSNMLGAYGG